MKPLNSLILLEYEEPKEEKTASGLYVSGVNSLITATDFLKKGKVLAINDNEKTVKVGDIVLFNYNAKAKVPDTNNQKIYTKFCRQYH